MCGTREYQLAHLADARNRVSRPRPFSLRAQQRCETADLKTAKGVIVRSAQLKSRRDRATNASDARSCEAETLGCYGEYVERPDEIRSALSRSALT
jgi:hypothetical protein